MGNKITWKTRIIKVGGKRYQVHMLCGDVHELELNSINPLKKVGQIPPHTPYKLLKRKVKELIIS